MINITYAYEAEVQALKEKIAGSNFANLISWQRIKSKRVPDLTGRLIINTGFAGALNQGFALGQVVLVDQIIDQVTGSSEVIDLATKEFASQYKLPLAKLLTTKNPVVDSALRDELRAKTGADIVDMEGFNLFKMAKQSNIPIVSFKVISDNADNDAWNIIKQYGKRWSEVLGKTVFEFLQSYKLQAPNNKSQTNLKYQ